MFLIGLNLVIWDREDTRPEEELDFLSQFNLFTDPKTATTNAYVGMGMVRNLLGEGTNNQG